MGDTDSGNLSISGALTLAVPVVSLRSGGSITEIGRDAAGNLIANASSDQMGSITVGDICLVTDKTKPGTVELLGKNDFLNVAAGGHEIKVNDIGDFSTTDHGIDDCDQRGPSIDRNELSFVPVNSELIRFSGADNTIAASAALSALSSVVIPTATDTSSFSAAALSTEEAAQILPAGSIGTLWLSSNFRPRKRNVEDRGTLEMDQWTRRCRGQHRGAAVR